MAQPLWTSPSALRETQEELTDFEHDIGGQLARSQPGWVDALVDGLTSGGTGLSPGRRYVLSLHRFLHGIRRSWAGFGSLLCLVLLVTLSKRHRQQPRNCHVPARCCIYRRRAICRPRSQGWQEYAYCWIIIARQSIVHIADKRTRKRRELLVNGVTLTASFVVFLGAAITLGRFSRVPFLAE